MDDHLAKPYTRQRQQLATMLAQWLPARCIDEVGADALATMVGVPHRTGAQAEGPVLDPAALANIRAVDDDGSVLAEVIQLYLDEAPGQLRSLRIALEGGRLGDLGRSAHALKSASLNVGARVLCNLCSRVERQVKAGDGAGTAELVAAIEASMARVCSALRTEAGNAQPTDAAAPTDPPRGAARTLDGELA